MLRTSCLAVVVALLAASPVAAGKYTKEEIQKAIKELGDKRFAVREKASKLLWEAGADAEQPLREALNSDDMEAVRRAKLLLDKFNWGIFPDTPPEIVDQINAFRDGDRNVRLQVVGRLMSMGKPGYNTLKRLAEMEQNPGDKQAIFAQMAHEAQRALPGLLAVGDIPATEELLDRCLLAGNEESFANYAAFHAVTGRLPETIARVEKEWEKTKSATNGSVLAHLLRAKGDFARARKVAADMKNESLVEQLLWEEGNWKELSVRLGTAGETRDATALAVRAAVHRLAGDRVPLDRAVAQLRKLGESDDRFELRSAAEALLLNGRHEDALKILLAKKLAPSLTFDLLFTRMQYKEAFEFADGAKVEEKEEQFRLDLRRARAHYILGERDKALSLFAQLAGGLKEAGELSYARDLVRTMVNLHLKDQAADHAARYLFTLLKLDVRDGLDQVLEPLFDEDAEIAVVWWRYLRNKLAGDDPTQVMSTVRRLLEGKPVEQRDAWCAALAQVPAEDVPPNTGDVFRSASPVVASAVVLLRAGQEAKAREYFERAMTRQGDASVALRYADFLAKAGRFKEAAAWYERAAKAAPGSALALFLQGVSFKKAGEAKEGERLTELAHRVPLGSEFDRGRFARDLEKRGYVDDARREVALVMTFGWYRYWHVGNVLNSAARFALRNGEFDRAILCYDKAIVGCLRMGASYVDHQAYLVVPQTVPQIRIRALLAEKKFDEALKEIRASLDVLPGNVNLVIAAVPAFDKVGRKKDADELFAMVAKRFEDLCGTFPGSAFGHNSFAWLAVNCDRDLDRALEHAKSAVKLEPRAAAYLDTLAEIHFRRGDAPKSVELIRKCQELEPGRSYYAKQLARYTKGDRSAPLPDPEVD